MTTLPSVWLLNDALDALAWRGSTLRERLAARTYPAPRPTTPAAPEPGIGSAPGSAPSSSPDAPAWLARWRALYDPAGPQAFARRLSWDGLDPSTIGSLVTPAAWRPAWTDRLEGIEAASDRFAGGARLLVSRASSGDGSATDPVPFAAAWAPVVASAREALRRRAPRLSSVLSPAAGGALDRALMADLSSVAELALHARFVEERGTEPVGTGEGAHDGFVERLLHGGWADVWRRYPVIARLTAVLVGQWVTSTAELIDRIEADRALLADTFDLDASLVSGLRTGLSDPHDGGRRVVSLRFASGLCLAYKPRDITIDAAFHRLLGWIARAGLAVSPPALTVVARESYGWMAWADNDEFDTTERVRDYYRRAGSLLCLTHVLGASDLHGENIVATRSGPVLVDAEALLQPLTGEAATGPAGDRRSCLLTGLLSLVHVDGTGQPYDVGGLRPAEPRTAEIGRRRWRGLASDQIGFDVETLIWPATPNEVRVADQTTDPRDHADEIIEGFATTWAFLARHRESLLAPEGPLAPFAGTRVRVLFRPSDQYGSLLHLLNAPRWQADGMDRSVALDTLNRVFARATDPPRLWPLVADEQDALENLDLPRFTIGAADTTIVSRRGTRIDGHFAVAGLEATRARLESMTDDDLAWQRDQIESVLRLKRRAPDESGAGASPVFDASAGDPADTLLAAATLLGGELLAQSRRLDRGAITWPGIGDRLDLYDGQAGPALALAALAVCAPKPRWSEGWRLAAAPLAEAADQSTGPGDWRRHWPALGAASGVASAIYTLDWLGRMSGDQTLTDRALALARSIGRDDVESASDADVERGLAGLILALTGLHRTTGDTSLLALAHRAADRVLSLAVEPATGQLAWPATTGERPAGFGHGASGIALALARLHALTSEPARAWALRNAAEAAWRFERSLFSPAEGNWPVARPDGSTVMMLGWCHGAPGIGLARALTPAGLHDGEVAGEIEAALMTTARAPLSRFDHVCCGNLSRADALITAGRRAQLVSAERAGVAIALDVASRVLAGGACGARTSGLETGQFKAGFFQGLSGILYVLARAADPDRLPSVLAFDLPGGDA